MYLDQFLPPDPVQIGHHLDLILFAEGQGFALPRVRTMLIGDPDRFSDLCGRTVGLVMPLLDWRGRDLPFCITACHGVEVVAAAWAGTITSRVTGAIGCNVSFGVLQAFTGRGLATILSAIAYQQCTTMKPMLEFVNVQTEAGNGGAQAVADRLGLARAPAFDRRTSGAAARLYVTYRASEHVVASRCAEILAAAAIDVRHAFHRTGASRSLNRVQPRFPLHPSIAAVLPPPKGSTMSHPQAPATNTVCRDGMVTAIDDESTKKGGLTITDAGSPAEALIQMLGQVIAVTPEARQAAERAVAALVRQFPRERIVLLTEDDRNHIIAGMVATRQSWESSGDAWISDVVYNGYDGYGTSPDIELLEAAFCDNLILGHLGTDEDRLAVLRILTRAEVLDIICSPERAQPVTDFDAFAREVADAISPMTGLVGTTARREHRLEAPKLRNLILQRLGERLSVEAEPAEDLDDTEAPRT